MIYLALCLIGFSGITAQLLLLRELLIVFAGNELSIGIILANWLLLGAVGSYLFGKIIDLTNRKVEAYVVGQIIFALALPVVVYLTRDLRGLTGVAAGVGFGFPAILYSSFLILLPVSIANGMLFTFGCRIYASPHFVSPPHPTLSPWGEEKGEGERRKGEGDTSSIGIVYVLETIGAIAGGLVFTYLFTPYFHSFQTAIVIGVLNLISGLLLIILPQRHKGGTTPLIPLNKGGMGVVCVLCVFVMGYFLLYLFGSGADSINQVSLKRQWRPLNLIHYQNSHYGNLVVTKEEEQYTFYSNGVPVITTPVPDIAYVEEFVHLPMLAHDNPQDILVLSGGAGGVINEILKHPTVKHIDYAEIDPLLFDLLRKFPTPLSQSELDNPKVRIHNIDGRLFVRETLNKYDLIFIGVSNPSDLQINRLFTKEFFGTVKQRLKENGLLALALPGSSSYLNEDLAKLNACVLATLKTTFTQVHIIAGDLNILLATEESVAQTGKLSLLRKQESRDLLILLDSRFRGNDDTLGFLSPSYIEYRLDRMWTDKFLATIRPLQVKVNSDYQPAAVIYSIGYWNAMFAPGFQKWFRYVEQISLGWVIGLIVVCALIIGGLYILGLRRKYPALPLPIVIMGTGFSGMVLNLILLFTFQNIYGYVFHQIGLLITAFMAGLAIGGFAMTKYIRRRSGVNEMRLLIIVELSMITFALILPLVFILLQDYITGGLGQAVFLVLACIGGGVIGAEFPLVVKIYGVSSHPARGKISATAGLIYGADLLGGWLGGIAGGILLLPVIGVTQTIIVIIAIKLSSIAFLCLIPRDQKQ